jgi:YD repeat-containing protein
VVTTYTYNSLNRLTDEVVKNAAGITLASYIYTMDNAGNRTGVTETQLLPNGTVNTRTVAYQYDNLYRLLSETISGDSQGGNGTVTYTYDLVGNRMSRTSTVAGVSTSTSTYNANDELTSETDAGVTTNYSYDQNGNTIETVTSNQSPVRNGPEITSLFKCWPGRPGSSTGAETNRSGFSCHV